MLTQIAEESKMLNIGFVFLKIHFYINHCSHFQTIAFFKNFQELTNIKSVHFKKTVAQPSFISKVLSFSLTLFLFQRK